MKLVVGLGNPGFVYSHNRHNVGFICLNQFAVDHDISLDKKQGQARVGMGEIDGEVVILARPQTFVNASGEAVIYLVNRYRLDVGDVIVIHDDLDLPLGRIRIKRGGGAGGHHGVESIINWLNDADFIRVRVGIGRPVVKENKSEEIVRYVLSDFTEEEQKIMTPVLSRVSEAITCIITEGLEMAMNRYNQPVETS